VLGGDQPEIGADGGAGEPVPVADLHRQPEPVRVLIPRRHASRVTVAVNSLSAAIAAIAASIRSRLPPAIRTAS
jgi:hypothetical protein